MISMNCYTTMRNGGVWPRPEGQISAFRECVDVCSLRDLGFSGNKFTWCKCREGSHCISECLDRVLVNSQWWDLFPSMAIIHGLVSYSNHVPIWVQTEECVGSRHSKKMFRFEDMWVGEKVCEDIVKTIWRRGVDDASMLNVMGLIKQCGNQLTHWNINSFGNV